MDKDSIVKKAEEYLEKNEYLKAYDHFKWAQKLDEQITNNIIHDLFKQFKEGITSNENPMVLAGIAYNIIDVCYDENIKFEGLRGAAEYLKREMKVWRTDPKDFFRLLACYYLLGDEEMADKVMQEIISANKKEIHR